MFHVERKSKLGNRDILIPAQQLLRGLEKLRHMKIPGDEVELFDAITQKQEPL